MSSNSHPPGELRPDDVLPPVEPPSAGFIIRLFVVPMLIVIGILVVFGIPYLLFNWLAQLGNDSDAYVRALKRNNAERWQAAFNLANALRSERNSTQPRLTVDKDLAGKLVNFLNDEMADGSMDEQPVMLRVYLCRALGEFRVTDPLEVLIKASTTERDPAESDVRRAALEGIAILATKNPDSLDQFTANDALKESLFTAAADTDPRSRNLAAVAMGVIGGPVYTERLKHMLADAYPDVRFNSATRLAQLGEPAAIEVLEEMLDPSEHAGIDAEPDPKMRNFKRAVITVNALRAIVELDKANKTVDLAPLRQVLERLIAEKSTNQETRAEATEVLHVLEQRTPAEAR